LIIGAIIILVIGFTLINLDESKDPPTKEETLSLTQMQGQFTLQDSSGKILKTISREKISSESRIFIKNELKYPEEKINAIKEAILSFERVQVPNEYLEIEPRNGTTPYFKGWLGAVSYVFEEYDLLDEPIDVKFLDSEENAEIIFILTDKRSGDDNYAFTNTIVDEQTHQTVQATIVIYNFDDLESDEIETITRHELGHALGMGHSTDPKDLMYPLLETEYPYISPCNVIGLLQVFQEILDTTVVCN